MWSSVHICATTPDAWLERSMRPGNTDAGGLTGYQGFWRLPNGQDDLTGNMATENIIQYFNHEKVDTGLVRTEFRESVRMALKVFPVIELGCWLLVVGY